jgi:acetate kinase
MNGIDAIIFGGGIGENSPDLRVEILDNMDYLGIKLDEDKNKSIPGEGLINTGDSKVKVFVARLDEELMIARETYSLVTG